MLANPSALRCYAKLHVDHHGGDLRHHPLWSCERMMRCRSRFWNAGTLLASVLILTLGWVRIVDRVRDLPSVRDDDQLTADEFANVSPGVLKAVVPRTLSSMPEDVPFQVLRLALHKSGRRVLGYSQTLTNQRSAVQRLAASPGLSRSNPARLTVGVFGVRPELHRELKDPSPFLPWEGCLACEGCG